MANKRKQSEGGGKSEKRGRILPPAYFLIAIVAMIAIHFLAPWYKIIDFPWTLAGIVPFLVGVALNLLADRAFKMHQTTVKPFEKSSALVTTGAYAISRNPMYLGLVLILLGIAVFMGSLTPFLPVLLFALLMELVFIRTEEKTLAAEFNDAWPTYKSNVRRWI